MIVIHFEDDDIMVVDKPAGLPSHKSANEVTPLPDYLGENLEPVHRLDQRVSGIILLTKNKESFAVLQKDFEHRRVKKKYRAIVSNPPPKNEDTLTHWIERDGKAKKAIVYTEETGRSKKSVLSYQLVHSSEKYHLLEVELFTGRFHQIRAQLSAIGCPIVGDIKYGFKRSSPDGSIFLQSFYLEFKHPKTGNAMSFQLPMPDLWKKYGF